LGFFLTESTLGSGVVLRGLNLLNSSDAWGFL